MNKSRRKRITSVIKKMRNNVNYDSIDFMKYEIEDILWEEQDAYDNTPESLQYSIRGEESNDAINFLQEAYNFLDEINTQMPKAKIENLIDEAIDALDYIL